MGVVDPLGRGVCLQTGHKTLQGPALEGRVVGQALTVLRDSVSTGRIPFWVEEVVFGTKGDASNPGIEKPLGLRGAEPIVGALDPTGQAGQASAHQHGPGSVHRRGS